MRKGVSVVLKVVGVVGVAGAIVAGYCYLRSKRNVVVDKAALEYEEVCKEIERLKSFHGDIDDISDNEVQRVGVVADMLGELHERKRQLEQEFGYGN